MQRVAIYGPNLPDQSKGTFHVHAVDCADRAKLDRNPRVDEPWTIDATSRASIVQDIYSPGEFDYDARDWRDMDDLYLAPCVKLPDDDNDTTNERWSVMTDEGLTLLREDLFTRDEALAHVAANPLTPNGTPQYAAPESVIRAAMDAWRAIGAKHEALADDERRAAVRELLDNDTTGKGN